MTSNGFVAAAQKAYRQTVQDQQDKAVEEYLTMSEDARLRFVKHFGYEPDSVDGLRLNVQGITLVYTVEDRHWYYLHVEGICPKCGERCLSRTVSNLSDIGEQLDNFQPDYGHDCKASEPASSPSLSDQLADLIRQIVSEASA